MAIIKSCCFYKTLRRGSFASAIYTLIYFIVSCISISLYLYDERDYLTGKIDKPVSKSFLGTSPMTVMFSMMYFGCAILGTLASILAIIGLHKDQREFLVPWILVMCLDAFVAFLHFLYVVTFGNLKFEPLTATLFTIDFFILCLNMYCLVCIVSQYQEYKNNGRGFTQNHFIINNGSAPEKSCMIIHQSKTSPLNNGHTNLTIIQDETIMNGSLNVGVIPKSPFQRRKAKNTISLKKSVKFTDDLNCCTDIMTAAIPEKFEKDIKATVADDVQDENTQMASN